MWVQVPPSLKGDKGEKGDPGPPGRSGGRSASVKDTYGSIELNGTSLEFKKQGALGPDLSVDLAPIATGEEVLAKRIDEESGGDVIYIGEAQPGTADSAALWRIRRITFTVDGDGDTDGDIEWANGAANFDRVWNDHLPNLIRSG